jgi:drug/metabolite transporter (DMT)-like permease
MTGPVRGAAAPREAAASIAAGAGAVRRPWVGVALVLLSAFAFSCTSISAVIAYGGGATPLAVITIRFVGAVVALFAILRVARVAMRLRPRERWIACALGLLLGLQSFLLYTSFANIPVALTMVIFYLYPLILGLAASVMGEERMTPALGIGLVVSFVGLLLVFNFTGEGLTLRGAGFAFLSCLAWGLLTYLSARLIKGGDSRPVALHMQVTAAAIYLVVCAISGEAKLPATTEAWIAYAGLPAIYAVASIAFFAGLARVGAVRSGFFMNFEPVATITLGAFVLAQTLTPLQMVGVAMVMATLFALRWDKIRRAK